MGGRAEGMVDGRLLRGQVSSWPDVVPCCYRLDNGSATRAIGWVDMRAGRGYSALPFRIAVLRMIGGRAGRRAGRRANR